MSSSPISEIDFGFHNSTLTLEWGIQFETDLIKRLLRKTLEVRFYSFPSLDLGTPMLAHASLNNKQINTEIAGGFTLFNIFDVATKKGTGKSSFRVGLPTTDLLGRFYSVFIDLDNDDIPIGAVRIYPRVEWHVKTQNWLDQSFRYRAVFIYHRPKPLGLEIVYETETFQHNPDTSLESPLSLSDSPQTTGLFIGRDDDLENIKKKIQVSSETKNATQLIIRGWPGVGKTTFTNRLLKRDDIRTQFKDGVLWASIGKNPDYLQILHDWGNLLGIEDIDQSKDIETAIRRIRQSLRDKEILFALDDVWEADTVIPLMLGGEKCFTIITTRFRTVADQLSTTPDNIYWLGLLSPTKAKELLGLLAPKFMKEIPKEAEIWLQDIELLPLSIIVGARLIEREINLSIESARELLKDLSILKEKVPKDLYDPEMGVTPTITVVLQKSTDYLDDETRDYFALLGYFAAKPATFSVSEVQDAWDVADVRPILLKLIDYGLIEPTDTGRFWMHALLVEHAKSLLNE